MNPRCPPKSSRLDTLLVAAWTILLCACPVCPEGRIEVVEGEVPVSPGSTIELVFYWDGEVESSPDRCGGFWFVDDIEGGATNVGTVTRCGVYTAPLVPPARDPVISASRYQPDACADCCPYAARTIALDRP